MDDESGISKELEEAISGALVKTKGELAYELKIGGKSLNWIADKLGYRSDTEVAHAISAQLKVGAEHLTSAGKAGIFQMEMDRLDRLTEKVWPSAMTGDPKSVLAALQIHDRRVKLAGLDRTDTATEQHTVMIIGEAESDYVQQLKDLADG